MMEIKKGKRLLILEAAYRLFLERGYTQTKISDIAIATGIGKGTVYEYFSSKEAIFSALFEFFADEYTKKYNELAQKNTDQSATGRLKLFIDFDSDASDFIGKNFPPSSFIELELFHAPSLMPLFQRFMGFKFQLVHDCICDGIKSGEFAETDPVVATAAFLGCFTFYDGFRTKKLPGDMDERLKDNDWKLEHIVNFIFQGLLSR